MKQKPFWKQPLFLSLLLFALFTFLLAVSPRHPTSPAGSDGGQIEESKIITQEGYDEQLAQSREYAKILIE